MRNFTQRTSNIPLISGIAEENLFRLWIQPTCAHPRRLYCLPFDSSVFVAALHQEKPVIVDFSDGIKRQPIQSSSHDAPGEQSETPSKGPVNWTLVVTYDRHGKRIYTGSNRGHITIYDEETRNVSSTYTTPDRLSG